LSGKTGSRSQKEIEKSEAIGKKEESPGSQGSPKLEGKGPEPQDSGRGQTSPDYQRRESQQLVLNRSKRESADSSVPLVSASHLLSLDEQGSPNQLNGEKKNQGELIRVEEGDIIEKEDQANPGVLQKDQGKAGDEKQRDVDIFAHLEDEDDLKKKHVLNIILENPFFSALIGIVTIYSLFSEDIKFLFTEKRADIVFNILNIIALVLFSFEILLGFIGKQNYRWSFFFWLDIISTVSMLLDLTWISNEFSGGYFDSPYQKTN
jgi:hypothetical protein